MKKTSILTIIIAAGFILVAHQQALARLSAPTLLSPENSSTVSDLNPTLDWTDVPGATVYECYIAGVSMGTTNQSEFTVPEGKLDAAHKLYSWNVRACANSTRKDCSSSTSWRFNTPALGAPSLVAPDNGVKLQNITPELKWDEVDNAYQYMVRVTNSYDQEVFSQTTRNIKLTVPAGKLARGNTYKWQVGACGASCSTSTSISSNTTWSSQRTFSTPDALPVPKLISPTYGIFISEPPVVLDWETISIIGGAYQYSYNTIGSPEILKETSVSRGTVNNPKRGYLYQWKVRYCTNQSATDCGNWSSIWFFYVSRSLEGPMVINTAAPGKYVDLGLRSRNDICQNARADSYKTSQCYKIYDSCFDRNGIRIKYCHITLEASFTPTNSYNIYFIDPDTGTAYKNLDTVPVGKALKLVIEEPEGEWFMAGGSFDSPPISWVNDAAADYQNLVAIRPLYEYTLDANSVSSNAYNILTPELGVSATNPLASGRISVEEVESTGKFEIYKENGDYFIKVINASGVGVVQVTVPDAFAYGAIDNMWFSPGKIPGAAGLFYFSLADDQRPIADAKISNNGIEYSNGPVEVIRGSSIYLSAEGSSDPDGWAGEKGISNGGSCEWTNSSRGQVFKKDNPLSWSECSAIIDSSALIINSSETYTLTIRDNLGLSASDSVVAKIIVGPPIIASLAVCPSSAILIIGNPPSHLTARYNPFGVVSCDDHAGDSDVTDVSNWRSDNSSVSVDNSGNILGNAVGSANVSATYLLTSGSSNITVTESCTCPGSDCGNKCTTEKCTNSCGVADQCDGLKTCGSSKWKEVAP